jgi:hypothetical protein
MNNVQQHPLQATVDDLALVKAQIANLKLQEDALKKILISSGLSAVDSELHRATISECAGKETTDWKSIALKFSPTRQLIRAHTSMGEGYFQVRVVSRIA